MQFMHQSTALGTPFVMIKDIVGEFLENFLKIQRFSLLIKCFKCSDESRVWNYLKSFVWYVSLDVSNEDYKKGNKLTDWPAQATGLWEIKEKIKKIRIYGFFHFAGCQQKNSTIGKTARFSSLTPLFADSEEFPKAASRLRWFLFQTKEFFRISKSQPEKSELMIVTFKHSQVRTYLTNRMFFWMFRSIS